MEKNSKKRMIFMGTPRFAQAVLETLIRAQYPLVAVVTQPDKPVGRKQILTPSPVKETALQANIPVLQPKKIRTDYAEVLSYQPDIIVTCAYGQFIPQAILDRCLSINVHASLLPELRGGAPMQRAIMNGKTETGVTIMTMAAKMDAGDIILQDQVTISEIDTLGSLEEKLIACGCALLLRALDRIENNTATYTAQNEAEATFGYTINKEEEQLSFQTENYETLYNHARALIPAPCAYAVSDEGLKIKFCAVRKSSDTSDEPDGTILGLRENALAIAKEHRILLVEQLQPEGRPRMLAKDFLNGAGRKLVGRCFL